MLDDQAELLYAARSLVEAREAYDTACGHVKDYEKALAAWKDRAATAKNLFDYALNEFKETYIG